MTGLASSSNSRVRLGCQFGRQTLSKVVRSAGIALLAAIPMAAGGCSFPAGISKATAPSGTPEAIVEGALRSTARAFVAPSEYRSGLLTQPLADAWIARVESDDRQWYASPQLDDMITAVHHVVGGMETQPGPILASVDGMSIDVPSAIVSGDDAKVDDATISYVKHYAPGSWDQPDVPYSAMCYYTLHRTADGWRVTDASCTDSGG